MCSTPLWHDFVHFQFNVVAAPDVYTVIPPQPLEKKPGQLEQWQLEQYFDKGFLVLPNFFSREEMQPAIEVRERSCIDHV